MDEVIQLFSFFASFCFGFLFSFLTKVHFHFTQASSKILQYLLTFLFVLDGVLFYVLLMYHINGGVIHIYFLFFVFLGFFCSEILQNNVKFQKIRNSFIEKFFRR